jgi:hypothetical protein
LFIAQHSTPLTQAAPRRISRKPFDGSFGAITAVGDFVVQCPFSSSQEMVVVSPAAALSPFTSIFVAGM